MPLLLQSDHLKEPVASFHSFCLSYASNQHGEFQVFQRAERGNQIEELENKTYSKEAVFL
jgi:hypothetical protein